MGNRAGMGPWAQSWKDERAAERPGATYIRSDSLYLADQGLWPQA